MMDQHTVTIRMGAAHNDVAWPGGSVEITKANRHEVRQAVVTAFCKANNIERPQIKRKKRRRRK